MSGDVPKFSLVRFKTLIRDTRGPTHPVNEVLHTQEELDEYLASCQDKPKLKHPVAFPEERAVAVALGSRPHGGYHVEIIAVVQETGGFVGVQHHVLYVEQVPHGLATDMVTFPQHLIRVRGLGGVVSFRQVPDTIGHSLHALVGAATGAGGMQAMPQPTTAATGEEETPPTTAATGEEQSATPGGVRLTTLIAGEEHPPTAHVGEHPTTFAVGEEGTHPTTLMIGEEGTHPTTLAVGEEGMTTHIAGEEHPPTAHVGEHPTTLAVGEEGVTTFIAGEEHPPTAHVGEHPTTLAVGEEGLTTFIVGEEHPPTAHVGEHPTTQAVGEEGVTTFIFGEETPGFGGGGGRGPFG